MTYLNAIINKHNHGRLALPSKGGEVMVTFTHFEFYSLILTMILIYVTYKNTKK